MTKLNQQTDELMIELNSLGHSLAYIANAFNVHPTTVRNRLIALNVSPVDTRRSFMDDVLKNLNKSQIDWLSTNLASNRTVKDFVVGLIQQEYLRRNKT